MGQLRGGAEAVVTMGSRISGGSGMYEKTSSYQLKLGYESKRVESHLLMGDYTPLCDYLHTNIDTGYKDSIEPLLPPSTSMNGYPWSKTNELQNQSLQLLHRSEGAILFKLTTSITERVIKYFKLNTQLLAEAHFEVFLDLVEKLKALQHPGVVTILEAHASTQGIYVIMEYVEGVTLKDWLRDEPLPALERRLQWYQKIVEAVSVLHQAGIVHGDLKSSNIMVRSNDQPVLLDFGLDGQLLREAGALAESEIYGTPYYVSPELIMGDPLDQQADIYALGILFYEVLTGEKPYQGRSLELILRKHMLAPIPTLPDSLARYQPILNRAMAKIPESRFSTAQQLLAAVIES